MSEPLDIDAIERAARCPCGEPGCTAEARDPTVLALVSEVRRLRLAVDNARHLAFADVLAAGHREAQRMDDEHDAETFVVTLDVVIDGLMRPDEVTT